MKLMSRLAVLVVGVLSLALVSPAPSAYAWNPFGGVDCSNTSATGSNDGAPSNSTVCTDGTNTTDPISGSNGLIFKIVNIVAFVSGAIAVIIIILAGLRFVTSGGSSEDVAGARRTLIYAAVGLVVIVIARTLVAYVLGKI